MSKSPFDSDKARNSNATLRPALVPFSPIVPVYGPSGRSAAGVSSSVTRTALLSPGTSGGNGFVLATVINHYPLRGTIKQIPGAFDRTLWRAAGKAVTLDQIEKTILPEFKEPRLYLALGRGAVGSGRLRSEAYTGDRLEKQLADIQSEYVTNFHMYRLDRLTNTVAVTPIMSWREAEFVAAYADKADALFAQRSPIERAAIAFITPHLLPSEKEFVKKNEFKMTFLEMDWRLNDLTGGRVE